MTEKLIIEAYCRIRTIDNSIPDDVLDFMKESALEKLRKHAVIKSVCDQCRFENECRFKAENVEQNCKFFIDKQTVL